MCTRGSVDNISERSHAWFTSEQINLEEDGGARACGRSGDGIEPASRAVSSRYSGSREHESLSSAFRLESLPEEVGRRQMHRRTPGAYPVPKPGKRKLQAQRENADRQMLPARPRALRVPRLCAQDAAPRQRRGRERERERLCLLTNARDHRSLRIWHRGCTKPDPALLADLAKVFLESFSIFSQSAAYLQPTSPRAKSCISLLY